jgi:hypothetical protein
MEGGAVWHNFERNPPKDHHTHVWLNMVQWFQGKDLNVKVYDITENRNYFNCPLLLYCKSKWAQKLQLHQYMAMSTLPYIPGFSVKFFFQPINNNFVYFEKKNHLKIFCSETWAEIIFDPRWLPILLAEISNGKKKKLIFVLCNLKVKLKTRWAIIGSWQPIWFFSQNESPILKSVFEL